MMFKHENKQFRKAFNNFFTKILFKKKTRSNNQVNQLISNCIRNTVSQQSLKIVGPEIWNKLSSLQIRYSRSAKSFSLNHTTLNLFPESLSNPNKEVKVVGSIKTNLRLLCYARWIKDH